MRWVSGAVLAAVLTAAATATSTAHRAALERRQAALGGGNGTPSTSSATTPQSIKGYTPPPSTSPGTPTNFQRGTILDLKDVKGYEEAMSFAQSPGEMVLVPTLMAGGAAVVAAAAIFL